jgi:hypothetical protein
MVKQLLNKIQSISKSIFKYCLNLLKNITNVVKKVWNKIEEIHGGITGFYHRFAAFLINKVWPITKKLLIAAFLLIYVVVVCYLTKIGLESSLSNEYNSLLGVVTSTVGTIVAIFFSLILIPLNQVATKYSPKFLKYLRKDPFFIFVFLFSIVTLVYGVAFLFLGSTKSIAFSATLLFVSLIVLLGLLVLHVIKLLNPYNSILLPAHKEIVKTFRKMIPRYRKTCEKMIKKTFEGHGDLNKELNICLFKVDDDITNYIQESLLPIREVAIKAIKDIDLEQAKNAIQTMMSVVVNYLYSRRQYHTDNDPLLYFLYTEFKLIAQAASNELKIRLHPFIVDCWRQVGVRAAIVNVKGMKRLNENYNFLVTYPVMGLKELCALNLLEMDSYAPGRACNALADIGVQLMMEGYDKQAVSVVEELEIISIVAEQHKTKHVSGSADYAMMRIYVAGVIFRNSGSKDPRNFPYRKINKSINNLLEIFLKTEKTANENLILSPFIGNFMDPIKGLYLCRISEYGVFSQGLDKFALEMNLECVRANIKSIKRALELLASHKDWYFSNQAIENLYRIVLNLLSYLNRGMAKDHILFYKVHPFIDKDLTEKATEIVIEGFSVLCDLVKVRADRYIFQNDHIHILFSLYFIILYEYKFRPNESLKELFEKVHEMLQNLLAEYKALPDSDSNDDFYKYCRLLVKVLSESDFQTLTKGFDVPEFEYRSSGTFVSNESQYPETMHDGQWILKRPGFQVNSYYYNDIEGKLKLDVLKFY